MPHARLQALGGRRHSTLSAMDVIVSPVPLIVGPGAGHHHRRPNQHVVRQPTRQGHPGQPRVWLQAIVALGVTAIVLGTLPLCWRGAQRLNEHSAQAITRATIDGFGGAIGGGVLGPVLSRRR